MIELSLLIPSRCEQFLIRTVQDILVHSSDKTEIIVVLDGWECDIHDTDRVRVIRYAESIGQRAATNAAAQIAQGKYLMKVDAHCAFAPGFDDVMIADMKPDWTMVPVMRNLHAFNWVCQNGHKRYQGPSGPCKDCGQPTKQDVVWIGKENPQSTAYCFDTEPHFQYFNKFKRRPEGKGPLSETMSLQGSCFMVTKEKYFELDLCGEEFGSWGSQGIEVACKTWLSGGRVICNHRTWYAHMFRTQGGDFGFPYPQSGNQIQGAKEKARNIFYTNSWPKQVKPLSWLIEKFKPVPGWHHSDGDRVKYDKDTLDMVMAEGEKFNQSRGVITLAKPKPSVGLVYYSDGNAKPELLQACQKQIKVCCNGHELTSVTLVPMDFGRNILMQAERGYLTMFRQILRGIEESKAEVLFLVEHDCLYHPSHFDFIPPKEDQFYYDENKWHVDANTGHALFYNHMSVSMLCAYRDVLLDHYRNRVAKVEKEGFSRSFGFEPGTRPPPKGCDYYTREAYFAKYPSLDIRHEKNLTPNRWRKDQFRNQNQLYAWKEDKAWNLPGWDRETLKGAINAIP